MIAAQNDELETLRAQIDDAQAKGYTPATTPRRTPKGSANHLLETSTSSKADLNNRRDSTAMTEIPMTLTSQDTPKRLKVSYNIKQKKARSAGIIMDQVFTWHM